MGDEFTNMRDCQLSIHLDLGDPSASTGSLLDIPLLPRGGVEDKWSDVLRLSSIEPRGFPKRRDLPIANVDGGRSVEKDHVNFIARGSGAYPKLLGLFPFIPRPSQAKCTSKFIDVEDAKASKVCRSTHRLPINLAFSSGNLFRIGPKKGTLNLVHTSYAPLRNSERCEVKDGLRGKDIFDEGSPSGNVDVLAIPSE
jgi:hypothetical protein